MHTFGESSGTGVPAFLAKLWRLVEDSETNDMIHWSSDGRSFIIQNQAQFARDLLPLNYKHNNMASFIRQLNMYGFHKITSIDNGGLKFDRDEMEFSHPCFKRGHAYLLEHIKRKIANTKTAEEKSMKPETVSKVLSEVKQMRGRQESMDSRFSSMKQENESLWREVAVLRQKHIKQQQIVNKLIQFLVTIVQPQRTGLANMGSGMKRRFQLMINDAPQSSKMQKQLDDNGPVIRELTEGLLGEVQSDEDDDTMSDDIHSQHTMSPEGLELGAQIEDISSPAYAERSASASTTDVDVKPFLIPQTTQNKAKRHSNFDYYIVDHIDESESSENEQSSKSPRYNTNEYDNNVLNTPMVKKELNKYSKSSRKRTAAVAAASAAQAKSEQQSALKMKLNRKSKGNKFAIQDEYGEEIPHMVEIPIENVKLTRRTRKNPGPPTTTSTRIMPSNSNRQQTVTKEPQQQTKQPVIQAPRKVVEVQQQQTQELQPKPAEQQNPNSPEKPTYTTSNKDSFLSNEIPTDLFDESSLLNDFDMNEEQQQELNNTYNNANMLNYTNGGKKMNDPTISGALCDGNGTGIIGGNGSVGKQMTLAKYNNNNNNNNNSSCVGVNDDEIYRLNSPDDINNHLEGVDGDLNSLKELLRGEGYQLDANALMGGSPGANERKFMLSPSLDSFTKLFGDNDLLSPYNLAFNQDLPNEKKSDEPQASGSELMTYQPYSSDLSDLLSSMNNDANSPVPNMMAFEDDDSLSTGESKMNCPTTATTSVLDDDDDDLQTPYHEEDISFCLK